MKPCSNLIHNAYGYDYSDECESCNRAKKMADEWLLKEGYFYGNTA